MKTNEVFPSKWLKAEDELFDNGEVTGTVRTVIKEKMGASNDEKPVMYFKEYEKGLVMNKTNWNTCVKLFRSDESDDWTGERVIMNVVETVAYGEPVKGIRIKEQKPKADRQSLLDRFAKLFDKARELNVEGYTDYVIGPNMTDNEIIALGKELKSKVEAAQQF